ncbi:hypothetical protein TorRG33x02_310920 [Trema orientale]|uniref:Uncharacterized protein n=1 Tax=Trema orientale TaxID=63057 RepID=A0A2P5BS64_TREOI|nr:hypothetical protein TorRG33x02_310920 [Trema orientale]
MNFEVGVCLGNWLMGSCFTKSRSIEIVTDISASKSSRVCFFFRPGNAGIQRFLPSYPCNFHNSYYPCKMSLLNQEI